MELYVVKEIHTIRELGAYREHVVVIFDSKEKAENAADYLNEDTGYITIFFKVQSEPFVLNKISEKELERHGLVENIES